MNNQDFRQEIENKKFRYLTKYASLMDQISNRGTTKGGDYIQFGPYFQTYMYAFMIGYHLGDCIPVAGAGETKDLVSLSTWKPNELVDYILMLMFSEPKEKLGFSWAELETMNDDQVKQCISTVIKRIEGYANAGLAHIQKIFNEDKEEFRDPFVFMNILKEVSETM